MLGINWLTGVMIIYIIAAFLLLRSFITGWRKGVADVRQKVGSATQPFFENHNKPSQQAPPHEPTQEPASQAQAPVENTPITRKTELTNPLASYEGVLLKAGFSKSEYGYFAFRLEIQNTELGAPHEIRGIDLKRALESSGAKIGDRIKASLAGYVEASGMNDDNTKKAKKKIWEVTKLE